MRLFHATLRGALLAAALLFSSAAIAGPPLLCHPFDTGGAASLPWGKGGWNAIDRGYDSTRLHSDTLRLLTAEAPVIARMETLRRAAIYASASGAQLRMLAAALEARITAASTPQARANALFDAGYFAETLQDIERLQGYDMPGLGKVDVVALRRLLAGSDGSVRIAEAIRLRGNDASMRFAAALVSAADQRTGDYNTHARLARVGVATDALLARNIAQLAD
ncbi:MAG: hypothetical protein QM612_05105 [Thermomonas sp.]|uniref:hypothetical protein n=1 Tax=Thermomonas sp. TaxID=1971895 RepID=UPI0039E3BFE2